MTYQVYFTDGMIELLARGFKRIEQKALEAASVIAEQPEIGIEYHPGNDGPPFACRLYLLPGTDKALYYQVNHRERRVTIFSLVNHAQRPISRHDASAEMAKRSAMLPERRGAESEADPCPRRVPNAHDPCPDKKR